MGRISPPFAVWRIEGNLSKVGLVNYWDVVMATIGWIGLLYIALALIVAALGAWLQYTLIWRAVKRGIREAAKDGLDRRPLPMETRPIGPA
jgi:hypothetical protein